MGQDETDQVGHEHDGPDQIGLVKRWDLLCRLWDKMGLIRLIANPLRQDGQDVTLEGAKKETERKLRINLLIWKDIYIRAIKMSTKLIREVELQTI